jgi:hypothetical protein
MWCPKNLAAGWLCQAFGIICAVVASAIERRRIYCTHLAGRTRRNGLKGTVISLCQPKEAPKLLAIAEILGWSMCDLLVAEEKRPNENENGKVVHRRRVTTPTMMKGQKRMGSLGPNFPNLFHCKEKLLRISPSI